jgi:long-chain acyl-CoA synthetase
MSLPVMKDVSADTFPWLANYAPEVSWHLDIPNRALPDFLDDSVQKWGDRPAIKNLTGKALDYKTLGQLVLQAASGLQKQGAQKGMKIGLFMPNATAAIVMYYAILKTGATVVNYNPAYVERDLISQIENSETDMLVTLDTQALFDKAAGLLGKSRLKTLVVCPAAQELTAMRAAPENISGKEGVVWLKNLMADAADFTPVTIDAENDIAVLQYTGGTTGVPKGAMLTHKSVVANAMQIGTWFHTIEEGQDSMIAVLPLFHVFAMTVAMNMPIMRGMQILLLPQFSVPDVLSLIKTEKPAFMAAVPTMYIALANDSRVAEYDFGCFKFCLSGGAPLPVDVKRVFEERTKARLVAEGYGLTEFAPVATCNPLTKKARAGSIGLPVPATIVEIISLEDGKTALPVKEKGEVVVSGPQIMKGYYRSDEDTAAVIRDGRLYTGDVGYMDADGFVYLVDRVKDLVLVGGYNVYPRHVEEVLYTHPAVEECIVAGVPDKLRGEAVQAWVKLRTGESVSVETLKVFLKDKLAPVEMPKKIVIRDLPLPKTAVGKLSKKALLEEEGLLRS